MQKINSRSCRVGGPTASWGSIRDELVIGRPTPWRQRFKQVDQPLAANTALTAEQQQIRRMQRELREAQMERDTLKKVVIGPPSGIFSKTDGRAAVRKYTDL